MIYPLHCTLFLTYSALSKVRGRFCENATLPVPSLEMCSAAAGRPAVLVVVKTWPRGCFVRQGMTLQPTPLASQLSLKAVRAKEMRCRILI